ACLCAGGRCGQAVENVVERGGAARPESVRAMRGATVVALICVGLLGGCATPDLGPTPAELKARWEAQNVYPQNYKADLIAFLRTYLNDPTHVHGAAVTQPVLKDVGQGPRYIV